MTLPRFVLMSLLAAVLGLAAIAWLRSPPPVDVGLAASGSRTAVPVDSVRLDEAARVNAGIEIVVVGLQTRRDRFEAPGLLVLDEARTARIGSVVEGKVLNVWAGVGDRVSAGQVLAEVHSQVIHEVWAAYRTAVAERRHAQTELEYSRQAYQRAQRLFADKAISRQEVQRALADRQAAEQKLDMAQTEVRRAEEALQHLGITSGDDPSGESGEQIPVRAPLAGAVLERNVTAETAVTPGMPLFVVSDLSTLWALAEVDETRLASLHVGLPIEVRVAAYPGVAFPGSIVFVADTLDPKTHRVTVRCRVPNPDGRLKPQMFATVTLGEAAPRSILAVPSTAVQEVDHERVVFVVGEGGSFSRRHVTTGSDVEGMIEIIDGLAAGERVVTSGSFLLKSELLKSPAGE